jgi:cytochrome P450
MAQAFRKDMLGTLIGSFREYGDVVGYRFGPRGRFGQASVAVFHPEDVRRVLTGTAFGRKTPTFLVLTELLGEGLLTSDGEVWRRQRRTIQPLFTPRRITRYADLMAAEAARVVDAPALAPGRTVDLYDLMLRYTLRVVGRALFGEDIDALIPALTPLVPLASDVVMARALQFARPPLTWPTPRARRMLRVRARLYGLVEQVLADRGDRPGDDLVARLLAARDPDTGAALSTQEIHDQILVFLLAGHETTAGALAFTLYLLGRDPEVQDRVAGDGSGAAVRAAVMEGMRLYPPAYATSRSTTGEVVLGGYRVPPRTTVFASAWVTHRHPAFWPDPERFDPGRFIGDSDRPRYAYLPFGGGPRSCVGEHFAMLEATILLGALLRRYRVESLDPTAPVAPLTTLRPSGPVRARLTSR